MSAPLPRLEEPAQRELLALARRTLERYLASGQKPDYTPALEEIETPAAAFVTLRNGGELRGCIGHLASDRPLFRAVAECVISAAVDDRRFRPVTHDELGEIDIEISVLTPFRRVAGPEEIEIGRHGLLLSRSGRRGLLLPQVAVEHGWDRETFLGQTCRKAGLPTDAWRDSTTVIEVFGAQVFSDRKLGPAT